MSQPNPWCQTTSLVAVNAATYKRLPYDPLTDFVPIGILATGPVVLVTGATFLALQPSSGGVMSDHGLADESAAMQTAIHRARESFPFFWRELSWEYRRIIPALDFSAVKLPFAVPQPGPGQAEVEHMWVGDLGFDGHTLSGSLLNTAHAMPGLTAGTSVLAPLTHLEDWLCASRGVLCGGFTVQALRAYMPEDERRAHDQAWGQPFPPPELCNITPHAVARPQASQGISRLWKKAPPPPGLPYAEALAHAKAHEHPMSENMRESIAKDLRQQPAMATQVFDDGWTLLHKDALGGNAAPVQALLAQGADREARTPQGQTALALAEAMGWERVVALLRC